MREASWSEGSFPSQAARQSRLPGKPRPEGFARERPVCGVAGLGIVDRPRPSARALHPGLSRTNAAPGECL